MVYITFTLAAILVVLAAVKLNKYGDLISQKSTLSGAMVGTVLIAGATSLPELTTSITAVYIDNVDIAVGNMLGSNVFNLLILAAVDFVYRRRQAFNLVVSKQHLPSIWAGFILTGLVIAALFWENNWELFNVGVEMFVLVAIYIVFVKTFDRSEEVEDEEILAENSSLTLKKSIQRFSLASFVVLVAGTALAVSGDMLAEMTGMNSSFVGSVLIAASTSLPELVAVAAAYQVANYAIAVGSILGSNLFNLMLLAITDVFYQKGAILQVASSSNMLVGLLSFAMMAVTVYILKRGRTERVWTYALPSVVIIVMYFVVSYMLF
ncbi:sodium:calcium antiporter [Halalkalibacillus halophilus]|uniref:sodium:calcium antiporter n=1 Tax=Halalkalibacillus halophilus TaxID=392827 RepID=UPI00041C2DF7|nr:sodium:calcium antiporter [Halalkalibacillus halophilus]